MLPVYLCSVIEFGSKFNNRFQAAAACKCAAPENIHSPPMEGFLILYPHPLGISIPRGDCKPPPTPWNFHDFSTRLPYPLESPGSQKKRKYTKQEIHAVSLHIFITT